ncbi:MAG: alpha/beta hydrolase, partial [Pseudomonadota bacterium]
MPFFKNEGINLYYEISGSGPALFLINGLAGDTRQWKPLIDKIKTSFQVISYDMRCAGQSDKPDKPFSLEAVTNEAYNLIRHLRHDKVHVLGFSMGGMVTMSLAQKYPDSINKIFLVSTTPSLKRPHPISNSNMEMLRRTDVSNELLTKVYESVFGPKYKKASSVDNFINFRMNDDSAQPAFAYLRQLEALESWDLYKEVEKISVPAIIVAGEEDKLIPLENSIWLNSHITGSKLYTLKDVGHMVPLEAPDELANILVSNK